jgi:hypothetical protein
MNVLAGIEKLLVSTARKEGVKTLSRFQTAIENTLFSDPNKVQEEFFTNLKEAIEVKAEESQKEVLFKLLVPKYWDYIKASLAEETSQPIEGSDILFRKEAVMRAP